MELKKAPSITKIPVMALSMFDLHNQAITTQMAMIYADGFGKQSIDAWLMLDSIAKDLQSDLWALQDKSGDTVALAAVEKRGDAIWLSDFVVSKNYRRIGVAQHFISLMYQRYVGNSNIIKSLKLKVRADNSAAISLYIKTGFATIKK